MKKLLGCGWCSWWGTAHDRVWVLVWQAVVDVPLRASLREFVVVVGESGGWAAWW